MTVKFALRCMPRFEPFSLQQFASPHHLFSRHDHSQIHLGTCPSTCLPPTSDIIGDVRWSSWPSPSGINEPDPPFFDSELLHHKGVQQSSWPAGIHSNSYSKAKTQRAGPRQDQRTRRANYDSDWKARSRESLKGHGSQS